MSSKKEEVRAGLLVLNPAQYFAPAFRALAERDELSSRVYFWRAPTNGSFEPEFNRHVEWNVDLYSGYDWWAAPSEKSSWGKALHTLRALCRDRPNVVLSFGWSSPVARIGMAYCIAFRVPFLVYGDSNGRDCRTGFRGRARSLVLKLLFRRAAGALSTGVANSMLYTGHGISESRIYQGVLPVATDDFLTASLRQRTARVSADRTRFIIGFAGKMVAYKGPDILLRAASNLPRTEPWELWFVGDGPMADLLHSLTCELGLKDRVRFLGFKNADEIPEVLASMDVLVMPSLREPRGLVAIEAMAAATVPVVSSATGVWGEGDAVQHGVSGLVYRADRVDELTAALTTLMNDPLLVTRYAEAASARALSFGPDSFAESTVKALLAVCRANRISV